MKKKLLSLFLTVFIATATMIIPVKANDGVAQIDNQTYLTLQDAFDAVPDGIETEIKLISDMTFKTEDKATLSKGKSIVLNMNGHKIDVDEYQSKTGLLFEGRPIINYGEMTINGNGTIDSSNSKFGGYGAVDNFGKLTIENGTYAGNVYGNGSAIRNKEGAETHIINGDFSGCSALYNASTGTVVIDGGVFHTDSCNRTKDDNGNSYWAYCVNNHGNITINSADVTGVQGALAIGGGNGIINGGTFRTVACDHTPNGDASYYGIYVAGETGVATATINGGTFISTSKTAAWFGNSVQGDGGLGLSASVKIYGGNFYSGRDDGTVILVDKNVSSPAIMGGIFYKKENIEDKVSDHIVAVRNDSTTTTTLDTFIPDTNKWYVTDLSNNQSVLQIKPYVQEIQLNDTAVSLKIGETHILSATLKPTGSESNIKWKSSNIDVATVDENGKVTAVAAGKATITATTSNGKSATCTVTVIKKGEEETAVTQIETNVTKTAMGIDQSSVETTKGIINESQVSDELQKAINEELEKGNDVVKELVIDDIDQDETSGKVKEDIEKIDEVAGNREYTVDRYLDLSILVYAKGNKDNPLGNITETKDKLTITVAIPKDLQKEHRRFYVIRVHDGETSVLPTKQNEDGTLTFETDKFSTYALAYTDNVALNLHVVLDGKLDEEYVTVNIPYGTMYDKEELDKIVKEEIENNEELKGYEFKGWYADEKLATEFDFTKEITEDTDIYMAWQTKKPVVTDTEKPELPVVPNKETPSKVKTGDNTDMTVYVLSGTLTLAGLATILVNKKRKELLDK